MTRPASKTSATIMQRAIGAGNLRTMQVAGKTRIADLYQKANAKIRIPKQHSNRLEAVLINTAGGLTGGDQLRWSIEAGAGTTTMISTQACERIYRAQAGTADVHTQLTVESGAHCLWLPQETILFDGASLDRKLVANLDDGARLTALETVILGREAMQEKLQNIALLDSWRVHNGERLIHADAISIAGEGLEEMTNRAHMGDHLVFGTLIDAEPSRTATEQRVKLAVVEGVHKTCSRNDMISVGVSVFDNKTIVRFTARSSYHLRQSIPDLLNQIVPGSTLPTVWRL
ncbi:MAG: urease accessory protein UreD [Pseudomonadota bacterium]